MSGSSLCSAHPVVPEMKRGSASSGPAADHREKRHRAERELSGKAGVDAYRLSFRISFRLSFRLSFSPFWRDEAGALGRGLWIEHRVSPWRALWIEHRVSPWRCCSSALPRGTAAPGPRGMRSMASPWPLICWPLSLGPAAGVTASGRSCRSCGFRIEGVRRMKKIQPPRCRFVYRHRISQTSKRDRRRKMPSRRRRCCARSRMAAPKVHLQAAD